MTHARLLKLLKIFQQQLLISVYHQALELDKQIAHEVLKIFKSYLNLESYDVESNLIQFLKLRAEENGAIYMWIKEIEKNIMYLQKSN